uniref:Reverse transcriptase domain-containing protein n=1 Tax=Rhizophora mucronata TaxID=61149 RepID=A0A2P2PCE5_RHIMU
MVFIDLEKVYDRVSRQVSLWAMTRKISTLFSNLVRDMYGAAVTHLKTVGGEMENFQGSAISLFHR